MNRLRRSLPTLAVCLLFAPHLNTGCQRGDGVVDGAVVIDADVARGSFVLYSFDGNDLLRDGDGEALVVADPSEHEGWDISASRWVLGTNSGSSGHADSVARGALLAVEGATDDFASFDEFSALCSELGSAEDSANSGVLGCGGRTPTVDEGYVADEVDDPDGAGPFPQLSFNASLAFWFEYQFSDHEVVPFGNVYVVETHDGRCAKVQFTDYYDPEGAGGQIAFDWEFLP